MEGDTLVFPIYLPGDFCAPFVNPLTATGPAVLEIFANPTQYAGKSLPVVGDIISPNEMVETFQRVTGKKAAYRSAYTRDELLRYFPALSAPTSCSCARSSGWWSMRVYGYFQPHRDLGVEPQDRSDDAHLGGLPAQDQLARRGDELRPGGVSRPEPIHPIADAQAFWGSNTWRAHFGRLGTSASAAASNRQ
jgi:hypothetical protein